MWFSFRNCHFPTPKVQSVFLGTCIRMNIFETAFLLQSQSTEHFGGPTFKINIWQNPHKLEKTVSICYFTVTDFQISVRESKMSDCKAELSLTHFCKF